MLFEQEPTEPTPVTARREEVEAAGGVGEGRGLGGATRFDRLDVNMSPLSLLSPGLVEKGQCWKFG